MKTCNKCGLTKPLVLFRKDKKTGYRNPCLDCHSKRMSRDRKRRPERHILTLMIQRCHNQKHPKYHHYGGRGIKVCEEWLGDGGFENFMKEIGPRPAPGMSIDRIDNTRGYCPGNVRWATQSQQMRNTRDSVYIKYKDRKITMEEAASILGLTHRAIRWRRSEGWTDEEIMGTGPYEKRV